MICRTCAFAEPNGVRMPLKEIGAPTEANAASASRISLRTASGPPAASVWSRFAWLNVWLSSSCPSASWNRANCCFSRRIRSVSVR